MIRALVPLFLLLLIGCAGEGPRDAAVEDLQLIREGGNQILRGTLVNNAERPIRGARIIVDLYDEDIAGGAAAPSDSASFEVLDIQPGEQKPFNHVLDIGQELTGARLARVVLF